MRSWLELYGPAIGRVMIALLFIAAGVDKLADFDTRVVEMGYMGVPFGELSRSALLAVAITIEIVGGLLLVLGLYARYAAAAILVFVIAVTCFYHPAWFEPRQTMQLFKNLAITGGLLYIIAHGPGRLSVDGSG